MAEKKQYPSQREKVKEITEQLENGIKDLFDSSQYRQWLTTMSRFHNYSLNNTILIAMQKPDATLVAGYTAWQKQFGRQVRKGEKAIKILAPTPYKKKMEVDRVNPVTGEIMTNPDGSFQKETKEVLMPAFKVVNVFDISSTDGKELPTIGVNELTGEVAQYDIFMEAIKRNCEVPIDFEQIDSGAKGYYHTTENRIAIQDGMSQLQTIKTAVHEWSHQRMHSVQAQSEDNGMEKIDLTRNGKEVEAESVAYTVSSFFNQYFGEGAGLDTSDYSFAYIAGWSEGKELPELKASLNRIRTVASEMITELQDSLKELGLDLTRIQPAAREDEIQTEEKPSVLANLQEKKEATERKENGRNTPKKCKAKEESL